MKLLNTKIVILFKVKTTSFKLRYKLNFSLFSRYLETNAVLIVL